MSQTLTYGTEQFVLFGEITRAEAYNLGKDMAEIDAKTLTVALAGSSELHLVGRVPMNMAFQSMERLRVKARVTLEVHHLTFQTSAAEREFARAYAHEFFGHFMSHLHAANGETDTL